MCNTLGQILYVIGNQGKVLTAHSYTGEQLLGDTTISKEWGKQVTGALGWEGEAEKGMGSKNVGDWG